MTEKLEELEDLAQRCELEAENWRGSSAHDDLLHIARQCRDRAAALRARSAEEK